MLTDVQKTAVRQHAGYPMFGNEATAAFGYRYLTHYGTLEYKLQHMSPAEEAIVIKHIEDCDSLEAAIFASGANLDTNKAAVWERNQNEVSDRQWLYNMRRRDLCSFIGIPPGPGLSASSRTVEVIV